MINFVVLGAKNVWKEKKVIFYELFLQISSFTWLIVIMTD